MMKSQTHPEPAHLKPDHPPSGCHATTGMADAAINVAEIRAGMTAAEIGTGTGFLGRRLASMGVRVIKPADSERSQAGVHHGLTGIFEPVIRTGRADDLAISNRCMDRVFSDRYLYHTPDPEHALKEMKRILKPGGRLVIIDLDRQGMMIPEKKTFGQQPGFYRSEIRHWLTAAGFSNIIIGSLNGTRCDCSQRTAGTGVFLATAVASTAAGCHAGAGFRGIHRF